jgi:Leucine-rich repeat (LRR) protein
LQQLALGGNDLRELPRELVQLVRLEWLELSDNPELTVPPPEIAEQGVAAVRDFLRQQAPDATS